MILAPCLQAEIKKRYQQMCRSSLTYDKYARKGLGLGLGYDRYARKGLVGTGISVCASKQLKV